MRIGSWRINSRSRAYPLTPALSPKGARGKGSRSGAVQNLSLTPVLSIRAVQNLSLTPVLSIRAIQNLSSTPDFQVDVTCTKHSVSSLSLRERARVRGFSIQNPLQSPRHTLFTQAVAAPLKRRDKLRRTRDRRAENLLDRQQPLGH